MKPSRTRLTCRAHNRFSPSIVLWQHFVGLDRPCLAQQRPSSTAAKVAQSTRNNDYGLVNSRDASGLTQTKAQSAQEKHEPHEKSKVTVRKTLATKGTWHATKVEASTIKNVQKQYDARKASVTASEQLLATARAAFEAAEDYTGVVVQPIMHPTPIKDSSLPWCLPKEERTMPGIDRLAIEIEKFYQFSRADHFETLGRRHLIEQVRDHVRETLPDHVLEVFGSERTGLALATSDIDFRLLRKEHLGEAALSKLPPSPEQRTEAMRDLHHLHWHGLRTHKAYLLSWLRYARYPLISLQDRRSGLDVQIVLSNDTSLSRGFIKQYLEEYPYLRQLYFVVKTMFDVRGLSDVFRGGFGSYSLFMMIVASIKHSPHPRNDAAGGLVNFLKFYRNFNTTKHGLSIEPKLTFDKAEEAVVTDTVKTKLEQGTAKPLPPYMLCLRDPADETNDLGRKAVAIKHVQTTFRKLYFDLDRNMMMNTCPSLLAPLVGPSYMLNKERREKLRHYGYTLSDQMRKSLAATAKMVRDREDMEEANKQDKEAMDKAQLVR